MSLTAVTLWQQTRLPDETGWNGAIEYAGRGSDHFYSGVCGVQTTTLYEKKSNLRRLTIDNRSVADQAHSIVCTGSLTSNTKLRIVADRGWLDVAWCWEVPWSTTINQATRDLGLLVLHSGVAPTAYLGHSARGCGLMLPILVGKGAAVHLLVLALAFSIYPLIVFVRGPLRRWRRRWRGECEPCGYNLTGNITGVCPECGSQIRTVDHARPHRV